MDDQTWKAEVRRFTAAERSGLMAGRWAIAAGYVLVFLAMNHGGMTRFDFTVMCLVAAPALIGIILLGWLFGGTWRD
jgi:hypothetical protein